LPCDRLIYQIDGTSLRLMLGLCQEHTTVYKIIPVTQQSEMLVNMEGVNTKTFQMFEWRTDLPPAAIKLRPNLSAELNSDAGTLEAIAVVCQQGTALQHPS